MTPGLDPIGEQFRGLLEDPAPFGGLLEDPAPEDTQDENRRVEGGCELAQKVLGIEKLLERIAWLESRVAQLELERQQHQLWFCHGWFCNCGTYVPYGCIHTCPLRTGTYPYPTITNVNSTSTCMTSLS